jgi:hypothetical protein
MASYAAAQKSLTTWVGSGDITIRWVSRRTAGHSRLTGPPGRRAAGPPGRRQSLAGGLAYVWL